MIARYSLTTRLTVFFTLASGLVLVGLGTLVAISIDRHFVELDRDALRDKIHLTREVIGKSTSPQDLKIRLDDVLHSHEGLFVSVFRDRDPLYATPDFQFPEDLIAQTQQARLGVASWKTAEREYRGMSASVTLPGSAEPPLQVWVAVDIAHHKHFMYALIQTLVGYVALATLVAGILGWWAAKNGLAPLRTMRSAPMNAPGMRQTTARPVRRLVSSAPKSATPWRVRLKATLIKVHH